MQHSPNNPGTTAHGVGKSQPGAPAEFAPLVGAVPDTKHSHCEQKMLVVTNTYTTAHITHSCLLPIPD